jgi:plastocyanin domain-containing protein
MLIINLLGLVLIVAIVWWFWLSGPKHPESDSAEQKDKKLHSEP